MQMKYLVIFTSIVVGFSFIVCNSYCEHIGIQDSVSNNEQQMKKTNNNKKNGIVLKYNTKEICHYRAPEYAPGYITPQKPGVPAYVNQYNKQIKQNSNNE